MLPKLLFFEKLYLHLAQSTYQVRQHTAYRDCTGTAGILPKSLPGSARPLLYILIILDVPFPEHGKSMAKQKKSC